MNKEVSKAILPLSDLVFLPRLCKPANTTRLTNQNDIALVSRSQLFRRARICLRPKKGSSVGDEKFPHLKGVKTEVKIQGGLRKKKKNGRRFAQNSRALKKNKEI